MISARQLLSLVFLGTILVSCKPDAWSAESNTSHNPSSSFAPGSSGVFEELPEVFSALDLVVEVDSIFTAFDPNEEAQRYQEKLYSDGANRLSLDLLAFAEGNNPLLPPSVELAELHDRRQLFLARFRNLSLHNSELAKRNYLWRHAEGSFQMAGRSVDKYRLQSVFNLGDIVLFVDQTSHMLMGWTLFDPAGDPLQRMVTTAVNFNPDFNSVTWADAPVATMDYLGPSSDLVLGFTPLKLTDSGPGFDQSIQKMLMTEAAFPGISNIHLDCLGDGLRTMFVAQRETGNSVGVGGSDAKVATLSYARSGGTTVLEGAMYTKWIYVVGSIPVDDLLVIANSLVE